MWITNTDIKNSDIREDQKVTFHANRYATLVPGDEKPTHVALSFWKIDKIHDEPKTSIENTGSCEMVAEGRVAKYTTPYGEQKIFLHDVEVLDATKSCRARTPLELDKLNHES